MAGLFGTQLGTQTGVLGHKKRTRELTQVLYL
jgi:hypothetical protein